MPELATLGAPIRTALEALSEDDQIAFATELVTGGSAAAIATLRDALGALDASDVAGLSAEVEDALEAMTDAQQAALVLVLIQGADPAAVTAIRDAIGALDVDDIEGLSAEIATALADLPTSADRVAVLTSLLAGSTAAEQRQVLTALGTAPVVILTQSAYDALDPKDAGTLYAISD